MPPELAGSRMPPELAPLRSPGRVLPMARAAGMDRPYCVRHSREEAAAHLIQSTVQSAESDQGTRWGPGRRGIGSADGFPTQLVFFEVFV